MPYVEATILEVMRYKTLLPVVPHKTLQDTEVGGYFVPCGTMVMVYATLVLTIFNIRSCVFGFLCKKACRSLFFFTSHRCEKCIKCISLSKLHVNYHNLLTSFFYEESLLHFWCDLLITPCSRWRFGLLLGLSTNSLYVELGYY